MFIEERRDMTLFLWQ